MKKDIKKDISARFLNACDFIISEYKMRSDAELCRVLEIHVHVLSDIRTLKANVTLSTMNILLTKYKEINAHWMIIGEGKMTNNNGNVVISGGLNSIKEVNINNGSENDNLKIRLSELEKENQHFRELLEMKDEIIGLLKSRIEK